MPHTRKSDQTVEAFSGPKDLIRAAKQRAASMGMTKSGFFRYCLAKELGYSDDESRELAQHNTIRQLRHEVGAKYPEHRPDYMIMNDSSSEALPVLKAAVEGTSGAYKAKKGPRHRKTGPA